MEPAVDAMDTRHQKSSSSAAESGSSYTPGTPALAFAMESPQVVSSGSFSGASRDDASDGSGKGPQLDNVPPVPPLPRSFQSVPRSTTLNDLSKTAAYYLPIRDEPTNTLAVPPHIPNSTSSPALAGEVFSDTEMTDILKSPALSVTSPEIGSREPRTGDRDVVWDVGGWESACGIRECRPFGLRGGWPCGAGVESSEFGNQRVGQYCKGAVCVFVGDGGG
jgi:hypothetical protein